MSTFCNDIRYGLRKLAKSPGFAVVVILIIGMAVGANTAIFNALDQVAMRTLPVEHPHEMVSVQFQSTGRGGQVYSDGIYNYPVYEAYRDHPAVFSGLIAFTHDDMRLHAAGRVQTIKGLAVTGNYFSVLGVDSELGRFFTAEREPDATAHPVAVISHRAWQRYFAGDPNVIGERLTLNEQSLTVIGVSPPDFHGTIVGWVPEVYIPVGTQASMWHMDVYRPGTTWLYFLGRLEPGISRKAARASLAVLTDQLKASGHNVHGSVVVVDGSRGWIDWQVRGFDRLLSLFMIAAALILVIASFNIANLQLSRAVTRQKEIAIRQSLGANRGHIVRQFLIESLLLAVAGAMCGMALAIGLDRVICSVIARIGSISMMPGLDGSVVLFALVISLFAGLVFGVLPALQAVRRHTIPALMESTGLVDLPMGRWHLHHLLTALQVALAVVILTCASLFVRSMRPLNHIDPGYEPSRLLAVSLEGRVYDRPNLRRFMEDLYERIKGLPGMEASCLASSAPLSQSGSSRRLTQIKGVPIPEGERFSWAYVAVSPDYFHTLNLTLLTGRLLSDRDGPQASRVMVINDVLARKYWPEQSPLGQYVTFQGRETPFDVQIVGVVKAAKTRSLIEGEKPMAYWPLSQNPAFTPVLILHTAGDPHSLIPMIREEVAALGPDRVCHVTTVAGRVAERLFPQRAITVILNTFALAGLVLCVTGLYSIIAYAVRQRTREIGIRMALGAETGQIVRMILGKGVAVTAIGLGLGLGTSLVAVHVLAGQLTALQRWNKFILYGVDLWHPATVLSAMGLLLLVAIAACYVPAHRATRIDPMEALRCE